MTEKTEDETGSFLPAESPSGSTSRSSATHALTQTIVAHRKDIFLWFLGVWVTLLAVFLAMWIAIDMNNFFGPSEESHLYFFYLAFMSVSLIAMLFGYILWHKDRHFKLVTGIITGTFIAGFVPLVLYHLP